MENQLLELKFRLKDMGWVEKNPDLMISPDGIIANLTPGNDFTNALVIDEVEKHLEESGNINFGELTHSEISMPLFKVYWANRGFQTGISEKWVSLTRDGFHVVGFFPGTERFNNQRNYAVFFPGHIKMKEAKKFLEMIMEYMTRESR